LPRAAQRDFAGCTARGKILNASTINSYDFVALDEAGSARRGIRFDFENLQPVAALLIASEAKSSECSWVVDANGEPASPL